jgi:hypothetical protein
MLPLYVEGKAEEVGDGVPVAVHRGYDLKEVGIGIFVVIVRRGFEYDGVAN